MKHRLAELAARHDLPRDAEARLEVLLDLLEDPAAPTAIHDRREAIDAHVADSLVALDLAPVRAAERLADLGAGAGVPGLVLAIALPHANVSLVESLGRKCGFLQRAVETLGLADTEVVCARAEAWEAGRERCDVVCARALAALPVLCEYAAPLLREGGVLVAWKGQVDPEEDRDGVAAAAQLGLRREEVRPVVPYAGSERRTLHVLRKVAPTPEGFPRRPGMAAKRPLRAR